MGRGKLYSVVKWSRAASEGNEHKGAHSNGRGGLAPSEGRGGTHVSTAARPASSFAALLPLPPSISLPSSNCSPRVTASICQIIKQHFYENFKGKKKTSEFLPNTPILLNTFRTTKKTYLCMFRHVFIILFLIFKTTITGITKQVKNRFLSFLQTKTESLHFW